MKKKESNKKKIAACVIPIAFIIFLLLLVSKVWREYTSTLMDNQIEQLSLTSKALSENMAVSIAEYGDNLDFLCQLKENGNAGSDVYHQYIQTQSSLVCNLYREDEDGTVQESVENQDLLNPILLTQFDEDTSIWQMEDAADSCYLVFKHRLEEGGALCLVIDSKEYYQRLISDIHIGTNGYVMIKTIEGIITMHPAEEQLGLHVIKGRKEIFPELDYSSLEQMVEEQQSGKDGVSEYYSYWWTNPKLPRVRKISAYSPVQVGESMWVVSAVVDYDDLYLPIQRGLIQISLIFLVILLGIIIFTIIIMRMISHMHKVTREIEDLREMNDLLEQMQRSEETIAHQQRLQIMGTVTGGIAHEFNNFLTPIMGYSQLLMAELPEGSEEQMEAQEIYEASEKARDVVRQISGLSRRNVETVYKSIQVKNLIRRALKMIGSVCPPQVRLECRMTELEDENILGNTTQINQVLLNICVNAVHAIGKDEGTITICAQKCSWEEIEKEQANKLSNGWKEYVHISIEDDGCGMSKDTLRQIFEPFFTTKKGGEGTGLGLALAQQIILSHKGHIYAESEPGKGSVFHIFLPVIEGAMQEPDTTAADVEYRIVVADDNAKVLKLLQKNFEKIGIQIITCMKTEELLENLSKKNTDVLVIDESIAGDRGVDFCMKIAGKYPNMLKLVMIDGVEREVVEAMKKGVIDGYIEKPVSDTTILEAIRNYTQNNV